MRAIYLVGTADTKSEELLFLAAALADAALPVVLVDVSTRASEIPADIPAQTVAGHHPDGAGAVLGLSDRGTAVAGMGAAFAAFCAAHRDRIAAIVGLGGGGGTSVVTAGMRALPYGVPKVMVSTLASGDVGPYVGTSDIVMMPSVTDIAGLNRISRHILHNAAQAVKGMVALPYDPPAEARPSVGLTMFGVTTPCVTQISPAIADRAESVIFHATGTGGQSMEQMLDQGLLHGLIDVTTTEIADEVVGGVLSAGPGRLDAPMRRGLPWVGSVGALDMVNFWAPDTVPERFADRQFYHHNPNVTLMRTTPQENEKIARWIAAKLNTSCGPVRLLLPEAGISALDVADGPFHDAAAMAALFDTLEAEIDQTPDRQVIRLPHHINDPAFSAALAETYLSLMPEKDG